MWPRGRLTVALALLLLVVGAWLAGCAAPAIKTTLPEVAQDPTRFRNKEVELTGQVVRNVFYGETYATWNLTLANDGEEVLCHEEGWNTGVLRQGWDLAERAREDGGEVLVTGMVRMQYREMARGERLDLRSISYANQLIRTDYADYPAYGWAGRYPHPMFFPPYYWRFHPGLFLRHGFYFPYYDPFYWYYFP